MSDVQVCIDEGVMTITIDRPTRKNALTSDMYIALASLFVKADVDDRVLAVVIRGSEQVFSAGNDLEDFLINPPREPDAPVWRFLHVLRRSSKPVVAAVCGSAIGIGATMLLHADIVVAGSNSKFMMPFVSLGVCPEAASSLLLPRLAGYQRACEMLLLGEPIDVHQAQRYGFVNFVVSPTEVFALAETVARKLARQPAAALRATRGLMRGDEGDPIEIRMAREARVFSELLDAPAAQAAIAGFLAKKTNT
jgi:enoyl-CoA hydratase/carnithine racemase